VANSAAAFVIEVAKRAVLTSKYGIGVSTTDHRDGDAYLGYEFIAFA